jgi:transposase
MLKLSMNQAKSRQRDEWLSLLSKLDRRVKHLDEWLKQQARKDERVLRLQTHPGVGLLTSLALVHTPEPVSRFSSGRKVAAYVGLEPMEYSSADKQRFLGISKGGSRLLRYLMVEATQWAVKSDSQLKPFYIRVAHRRGVAEGESSGGQEAADKKLHHIERQDRLR